MAIDLKNILRNDTRLENFLSKGVYDPLSIDSNSRYPYFRSRREG